MIADQPHSLSQSPLEKDFEAGVHFGIGGFNLVSGTDGISAEINNYSTGTHWIWDDRQPKLAIIISYPTSASGIIVSLKNAPKCRQILPKLLHKNKWNVTMYQNTSGLTCLHAHT